MKIRFWHLLLIAVFLSGVLYISIPDITLLKSIESTGVIFFMIGVIVLIIQLLNNVVIDTEEK